MELSLNFILFLVLSFLIVYVLTNCLEKVCQKEEFENKNQSESNNKNLKECEELIYLKEVKGKKLFNLDDKTWGWIGVGTNGASVVFQYIVYLQVSQHSHLILHLLFL